MYQLSKDPEFAFVLAEYMSLANEGGSASGEVLSAAAKIKPGDTESWYREFKYLADKIHAQANLAETRNSPVSARKAFFRSASYYRGADFFLHGNQSDPRINTLWERQHEDFTKAVSLLPSPPTFKELSAKGFKVPVYFYPADKLPSANSTSTQRLPTVIVGTGYDGSQEELYHSYCREVVERGYNCITYEGPGQPTVRRQQHLGFIPEWWEAVTPVVDYIHTRNDVDTKRIALVGVSFGGLLAPLAATKEHRLGAVIAIDGWLNLQGALEKQFPKPLIDLYKAGNKTGFNEAIKKGLAQPDAPTQFRWGVYQGMWAWNTMDPFDWFNDTGKFLLTPETLQDIKCPVFVASGQDDSAAAPGQPEQMARLLGKQAHYHLFKTDVGAGEHCAIGAEHQLAMETLDWLKAVFADVEEQSKARRHYWTGIAN